MNVYLVSFGDAIRKIRNKLKYTQNYVSEITGINMATIRRIENGKVIPKFETLELLSSLYKTDLNDLFLKYRIYNYTYFYEIKNRLEEKLDNNDYLSLNIEFKELNILLNYMNDSFYKNLIAQLSLLTEAVILFNIENNEKECLNKLMEAIKVTNPNFDLSNYHSYVYSSMEIRILINISSILYTLEKKDKYKKIMEFCLKVTDLNDDVYPKICFHLSGMCVKDRDYERALELSNAGINSCKASKNLHNLSPLYYIKGIAEYLLNIDQYTRSFDISIMLCEVLSQNKLKDIITKNYDNIERIEELF